jgi:hypothetical protein
LKLIASLIVAAALVPAVSAAEPGKPYKTYAIQKGQQGQQQTIAQQCPGIVKGVKHYRTVVWNLQQRLSIAPAKAEFKVWELPSCRFAKWTAELWRGRTAQWTDRWIEYKNRPKIKYLPQWICIHNHEGAWNANTGNGYYGGLQMDITFMEAYGSDMISKYGGYAHTWSPRDQIIVAERAYDSGRGFGPWPNTRRMCGI